MWEAILGMLGGGGGGGASGAMQAIGMFGGGGDKNKATTPDQSQLYQLMAGQGMEGQPQPPPQRPKHNTLDLGALFGLL